MKKFLLFICLFIGSAFLCTAQLKVDSIGRFLFGKNMTFNKAISIVDENTSTSLSNITGFTIHRKANDNVRLGRIGSIYGLVFGQNGQVVIGNAIPSSTLNSYSSLEVFATTYGGVHVDLKTNGESFRSKVDGPTLYHFSCFDANYGWKFYIKANGDTYANNVLLTSDVSQKENIELIASPLDKVLQLRGVTFDMKEPDDEKEMNFEELFAKYKMTTPSLTSELFRQIQEEKSRKRMGVIAQEVEKIIPEVVRTREDGIKAVAYPEMVGLLIEAIKELKAEVDELKGNTISGASLRSSTDEQGITGIVNPVPAQCKLYQNAPNPFQAKTEIRYFLPQGIQQAYLCIFDMQGQMLKKLDAQVGNNTLTIQGYELQAGMYLYSLIADGKEVDTKRMILTK